MNLYSPFHSVLFTSRPRYDGWPHHGRTFSIYPCPVILIDSSTESPVHVLMLSTQAVRGLPRLRAPGIVPGIISFSTTAYQLANSCKREGIFPNGKRGYSHSQVIARHRHPPSRLGVNRLPGG